MKVNSQIEKRKKEKVHVTNKGEKGIQRKPLQERSPTVFGNCDEKPCTIISANGENSYIWLAQVLLFLLFPLL